MGNQLSATSTIQVPTTLSSVSPSLEVIHPLSIEGRNCFTTLHCWRMVTPAEVEDTRAWATRLHEKKREQEGVREETGGGAPPAWVLSSLQRGLVEQYRTQRRQRLHELRAQPPPTSVLLSPPPPPADRDGWQRANLPQAPQTDRWADPVTRILSWQPFAAAMGTGSSSVHDHQAGTASPPFSAPPMGSPFFEGRLSTYYESYRQVLLAAGAPPSREDAAAGSRLGPSTLFASALPTDDQFAASHNSSKGITESSRLYGQRLRAEVVAKLFIRSTAAGDGQQLPLLRQLETHLRGLQEQVAAVDSTLPPLCPRRTLLYHTIQCDETHPVVMLQRPYVSYSLPERLAVRPYVTARPADALYLLFQLLLAVEQLHEVYGLTHGDLKPSNCLCSSTHVVYLADLAPFKPARLPRDSPLLYLYYYDTDEARGCYVAPEKFTDDLSFFATSSTPTARYRHRHRWRAAATPEDEAEEEGEGEGEGVGETGEAREGRPPSASSSPAEAPPSTLSAITGDSATSVVSNHYETENLNIFHHTPSMDIFSLGCVFAYILVEEPCFFMKDVLELRDLPTEAGRRAFVEGRLRARNIPCYARPLLLAMLAPLPADRPSARELIERFGTQRVPLEGAATTTTNAAARSTASLLPPPRTSPLFHTAYCRWLAEELVPAVLHQPVDRQLAWLHSKVGEIMKRATAPEEEEENEEEEEAATNEAAHRAAQEQTEVYEGGVLQPEKDAQTEPPAPPLPKTTAAIPTTIATTTTHPFFAPKQRGAHTVNVLLPLLLHALYSCFSDDALHRGLLVLQALLPYAHPSTLGEVVLPHVSYLCNRKRECPCVSRALAVRLVADTTTRLARYIAKRCATHEGKDALLSELQREVAEDEEAWEHELGTTAPGALPLPCATVCEEMVLPCVGELLRGAEKEEAVVLVELAAHLPRLLLLARFFLERRESLSGADAAAGQPGTRGTYSAQLSELHRCGWEMLQVLYKHPNTHVVMTLLQHTAEAAAFFGDDRVQNDLLPLTTTLLGAPPCVLRELFPQVLLLHLLLQPSAAVWQTLRFFAEEGLRQEDTPCVRRTLQALAVVVRAVHAKYNSWDALTLVHQVLPLLVSPHPAVRQAACEVVAATAQCYPVSVIGPGLEAGVRPLLARPVPLSCLAAFPEAIRKDLFLSVPSGDFARMDGAPQEGERGVAWRHVETEMPRVPVRVETAGWRPQGPTDSHAAAQLCSFPTSAAAEAQREASNDVLVSLVRSPSLTAREAARQKAALAATDLPAALSSSPSLSTSASISPGVAPAEKLYAPHVASYPRHLLRPTAVPAATASQHLGPIYCSTSLPGSPSVLLTAGARSEALLWELSATEGLLVRGRAPLASVHDSYTTVTPSPGRRQPCVFLGSTDGTVLQLDTTQQTVVRTCAEMGSTVVATAAQREDLLLACSAGGRLCSLDSRCSRSAVWQTDVDPRWGAPSALTPLYAASGTGGAAAVALSTYGGHVALFDLRFCRCVRQYAASDSLSDTAAPPSPPAAILAACPEPLSAHARDRLAEDGPALLLATSVGVVLRLHLASGHLQPQLTPATTAPTRTLLTQPEHQLLFTAGDDGFIRRWSFAHLSECGTLAPFVPSVAACSTTGQRGVHCNGYSVYEQLAGSRQGPPAPLPLRELPDLLPPCRSCAAGTRPLRSTAAEAPRHHRDAVLTLATMASAELDVAHLISGGRDGSLIAWASQPLTL